MDEFNAHDVGMFRRAVWFVIVLPSAPPFILDAVYGVLQTRVRFET